MPEAFNWVYLAVLAPLCWSLSIIMDQLLVKKYFSGSVSSVFVYTGLVALPFTLVILVYDPTVLDVTRRQMLWLCSFGVIYMALVYPYLLAIKNDDASRAIPVLQIQPFLVLVLGWLFLGETLTSDKVIAGVVITLACLAITRNFDNGSLGFRTFILMLITAIGGSIYTLVLRVWSQELSAITITFWITVGWTLCGLITMLVHRSARQEFFGVLRHNPKAVIGFGIAQEVLDALALMAATAALAIAPSAAHVQMAMSVHVILITIVTGIAALFWKEHFEPLVMDWRLLYKACCALVLLLALYYLLLG